MGKTVAAAVHAADDVAHVVFSAMGLAEGCVKFAALLLIFSSELMMMIGIGAAMIGLRYWFFYMIPVLIEFAKPIVFILNRMIQGLSAFCTAAVAVVDAGIAVADAFGANKHMVPLTYWDRQVSVSEYLSAMNAIAVTCRPYTDVWSTWTLAAVPEISQYTCPYARAIYPVFTTAARSMDGIITVSPDPYGNNCHAQAVEPIVPVCITLSSGYIILEFVLPLMLLCLFLWAAGKSLFRMLWALSSLVMFAVVQSTALALSAAETAERIIYELAS